MRRYRKSSLLLLTLVLCAGVGVYLVQGTVLLPPSTGTWAPTPGSMASPRAGAASVLLTNGNVLVTGGCTGCSAGLQPGTSSVLASADLFTSSGLFTPAPNMNSARTGHTATLLQDGRVLVAGGMDANGNAQQTAELYDPSANAWAAAGPLMVARSGHTATLLHNGQVLIAGGTANGAALNSLELFDPTSNTFTLAPATLSSARENHAAALLQDGRVIIVGGWDGTTAAPVPPATTGTPNVLATSDIFDPSTGTDVAGPTLNLARMGHTATTQLDGHVFVAGGNSGTADLASVETFNPSLVLLPFRLLNFRLLDKVY